MTDMELLAPVVRECERSACQNVFTVSPKSPRQRFCSKSCAGMRPKPKLDEAIRFWSHVDRLGAAPAHRIELGNCWVWNAYRNPAGYGQFGLTGVRKLVLAYNWSWSRDHGPIPAGLVLDHLCRVPACVRPSHLEAVTQSVNAQRGLKGDLRPPSPRRSHCGNGHELSEANRYKRAGRKDSHGCRRCNAEKTARYQARKGAAR